MLQLQQQQHEQMSAESTQPSGFQYSLPAAQPQLGAVRDFNPFSEELHPPGSPWVPPDPRGEGRALRPVEQPLRQLSSMPTQARDSCWS